jgi:pyrophosphatase PpaX
VEEVHKHKPDPEPVLAALRLTGLSAADSLMVGDSPHDLISGQGAGLKTAAVRWTHVVWDDVMAVHPDYVLESMADILPVVFNENEKDGVLG